MKSRLYVDRLEIGWRDDAHSLGSMCEVAAIEQRRAMLVCKRQKLAYLQYHTVLGQQLRARAQKNLITM